MGAWQTWSIKRDVPNYRGYRFPPKIISHAVWLYHRFGVSFRDVEDLLAQRGITVSYGVGARKQVFVAALAIVTAEGA